MGCVVEHAESDGVSKTVWVIVECSCSSSTGAPRVDQWLGWCALIDVVEEAAWFLWGYVSSEVRSTTGVCCIDSQKLFSYWTILISYTSIQSHNQWATLNFCWNSNNVVISPDIEGKIWDPMERDACNQSTNWSYKSLARTEADRSQEITQALSINTVQWAQLREKFAINIQQT